MASKDDVWLALKNVIDPELGINIVDLGLVYVVKVEKGIVEIEMTLTSPGCPLAPIIDQLVKSEVNALKGVKGIELKLVWDPPWSVEMIEESARVELGLD